MFTVDAALLRQTEIAFGLHKRVYWIVGGAGSGKTTICQALAESYGLQLYDMDAHIYGSYHGRFSAERHPVNTQWAAAPNGLAWLMQMTWEQFDAFNKAAVPEYLDLLAEDLATLSPETGILIDGGIANPSIAVQAFPAGQMVCLARPDRASAEIWSENEDRLAMKQMFARLPNPRQAWQKFLEFDQKITQTMWQECRDAQIPICIRDESDSVPEFARRVARNLAL